MSRDILRLDAARRDPPRAIDVGMRHGPARIGLEGERLGDPALAEIADQRLVVAVGRVREAMEQAVRALEHRARPVEARACQQRGAQAGLRRPAGMHALGPGALGEIFDDAARHAARDAERVDGLLAGRVRAPPPRRRPRPSRRTPRSDESPPCAPPSAPRGSAGTAPRRRPRCRATPPRRPHCAARRPRAPPARSRHRHAPARPRTCRRSPRHAPPCR